MPGSRSRVWLLRLRHLLAVLAVALLARVVVAGWDDLAAAATVLVRQRPGPLVLLAVLVTGWIVALAEVQRASARALGGVVSRRDALRISRAAFTLSRVVPGGGAAGGVFSVREYARLGHGPAVAGGTALVSWAVSTVTFALLVLTPTLLVTRGGTVPGALVGSAALVLAGLGAAALLVLAALHRPGLRLALLRRLEATSRSGRLRRAAAATLTGLPATRGRTTLRATGGALGWSALAWLLDLTVLAVVFAAVGAPLPLAVLLVGFVSANLLNTAPELTPGWIGVYEVAVSAVYVGLGVPPGAALTAVLLHRLVAFWLPVAVGIVPAVRALAGGRRSARPAVAARPPAPPAPARPLVSARPLAPARPSVSASTVDDQPVAALVAAPDVEVLRVEVRA